MKTIFTAVAECIYCLCGLPAVRAQMPVRRNYSFECVLFGIVHVCNLEWNKQTIYISTCVFWLRINLNWLWVVSASRTPASFFHFIAWETWRRKRKQAHIYAKPQFIRFIPHLELRPQPQHSPQTFSKFRHVRESQQKLTAHAQTSPQIVVMSILIELPIRVLFLSSASFLSCSDTRRHWWCLHVETFHSSHVALCLFGLLRCWDVPPSSTRVGCLQHFTVVLAWRCYAPNPNACQSTGHEGTNQNQKRKKRKKNQKPLRAHLFSTLLTFLNTNYLHFRLRACRKAGRGKYGNDVCFRIGHGEISPGRSSPPRGECGVSIKRRHSSVFHVCIWATISSANVSRSRSDQGHETCSNHSSQLLHLNSNEFGGCFQRSELWVE